jgi:hypothetical protein
MYFDSNQPPRRDVPPARPASQRMDGTTRLLIVAGVAAVVTWFAWPYVRGEMGSIGQQLGANGRQRAGLDRPPVWDPLGMMPAQGGREARSGRRLRLPEGVGNARGQERYPSMDREERYPDRQAPPPRRWRDCGPGPGGRFSCGEWHDGAPPQRGGGRW